MVLKMESEIIIVQSKTFVNDISVYKKLNDELIEKLKSR